MSARWVSLLVWAAVAASALYWGLALFVQPLQAPAGTRLADPAVALRGDLTRLLGADAPPPAETPPPAQAVNTDPRFTLVGVVSPRSETAARREGVALIATDGEAPRAYRVGAVIDGDQVLQAVSQRGALIGPRNAPPTVSLELPPPAPATTGTPTPAPAPPPGARPPVRPPTARAQVVRPLPSQVPTQVPAPMPAPAPAHSVSVDDAEDQAGQDTPIPQPPIGLPGAETR